MFTKFTLLAACSLLFLSGCKEEKPASTPASKPAATKSADMTKSPAKKSKKEHKSAKEHKTASLLSDSFDDIDFGQQIPSEDLAFLSEAISEYDKTFPDQSDVIAAYEEEFDFADADRGAVGREIEELVSLWKEEDNDSQGLTADLHTFYFQFNDKNLSDDQRNVLDESVEHAKQAAAEGKRLIIEAYANDVKDEALQLSLSQQRAEGVADELVKAGVPGDAITAIGRGGDRFLATTSDLEEEMRDELSAGRRADVTVIA